MLVIKAEKWTCVNCTREELNIVGRKKGKEEVVNLIMSLLREPESPRWSQVGGSKGLLHLSDSSLKSRMSRNTADSLNVACKLS